MNKTLWAIVVIIIVVLVGWFIYYEATDTNSTTPATTTAVTATPATSAPAASDNVYLTGNDPTKGAYMTDPAGKTLYTYGGDTTGVSNCTGACAAAWPPYTTTAAPNPLPANITIITRADGTMQYAYNGMPLYYFASDTATGQINGDGVGNFHIVKM